MDQPRYDEGDWPIVLVSLPKEDLDRAKLLQHVEQLTAFTRRGRPYVQIIDVRGSNSLNAEARRVVVERMDQDEETHPGILLGVAMVLATPMHRGIFKAISWLTRTPRPFEAFSEIDDAKVWARDLIARTPASQTMRVSSNAGQAALAKRAGER